MQPGFRALVDGVDDAERYVAKHAGYVDDQGAGKVGFEMWKEVDGEVHEAADVDVDFSEIEI